MKLKGGRVRLRGRVGKEGGVGGLNILFKKKGGGGQVEKGGGGVGKERSADGLNGRGR